MNLATGLQRLQDSQLRVKETATKAWFRFGTMDVSNTQWAQLGMRIIPDPNTVQTPTYKDVQIDPPPAMRTLSLHNIGVMGTKLRCGAKSIMISATFIDAQAALLDFDDPYEVFRQCLGIVNENKLYSIEDIQHEIVSGRIINWMLICNANELR